MNTLTVKAPAISCGHCVHTVQTEVCELAGVQQVTANEQTKVVTIQFEAPATEAQIKELMAEIGYPAEPA
ncbi:MAG: heavy-metal-associated domain-containing protein [Caldilineaceae bacterium]|mgnify:CR=1 FL=1|nr:heavy-metal-associated domain-containing protein [Caldilineaceae bacterium]